ncbi:MAG: hypothetical protein DMG59_09580 [Acidobacteria bacterium]|jgi:16S rRNA (guanine527-N7)-methyltransferase|nr:MAG: hypothetical protein DMG59_09580 [Acidobacteriota bacterium]
MFRRLLLSEFPLLSGEQVALLERHFALVSRWNQKINLTRIQSVEEAVRLHYCESLFLGQVLPLGQLRIVDVGSGAGFPGIPVAVLRSDCAVDLVESHQRKAVFLREATRDLPNVRVFPKRAASLASSYDWMIARAIRPADVLSLALAPNVALLTSAQQASNLVGPYQIEKVPWGEQRVLVVGEVPRGTC